MDPNIESLVQAIFIQAVRDYQKALRQLKKHPKHKGALIRKWDVEDFFLSGWFGALTDIDPIELLTKIRAEVNRP